MNSYYYNNLDSQGKAQYNQILNAIKNRSRSISIGRKSNSKVMIEDIIFNHPELIWIGHKMLGHGLLSTKITMIYAYDSRKAQVLNQEIQKISEKIIRGNITEQQSEYDKVLILHDFLKQTIQYDTPQMNANVLTYSEDAHNLVGALINKKCVCEGFAKAMKYLCNMAGVECYVVTGIGSGSLGSGPHAWNVVKINGYFHHVDVTWDNQYSDENSIPMYAYFNLDDNEISKDHTWDRTICPACPDDPYNYFKMNRALISSKAQLENFFIDNLSLEEQTILFKVQKGSLLEREIMGCINGCFDRACRRCKYINVKGFSYSYVPEQLVFSLTVNY